jgi:hypothetical protein
VSWYPYSSSKRFCKKPRTGSALSEALHFYEIPGPGSSGGEATGPTECITRASTIGSIKGPSSRYDSRYVVVDTFGPFRGRKPQGRFNRWPPYRVNFVRFGSLADIRTATGLVSFVPEAEISPPSRTTASPVTSRVDFTKPPRRTSTLGIPRSRGSNTWTSIWPGALPGFSFGKDCLLGTPIRIVFTSGIAGRPITGTRFSSIGSRGSKLLRHAMVKWLAT